MRTGEMGIGRLAPLPLKAETLRNRFVEQSTQPPRVKAADTWQLHHPSPKQPPALALDESVSQSPAPPPLHPPPPLLLPYPLRQSPIRMPVTPLSSYLPSAPFQSFADLRQQLAANTSAMSWLLSKPNSNQLHNGATYAGSVAGGSNCEDNENVLGCAGGSGAGNVAAES